MDDLNHSSGSSRLIESEPHQTHLHWNATQVASPRERYVHQLTASQAERTPEAIAAVFEEHHITCKELNRRANQLARYAQAQGADVEQPVAVYMERSLELLIGLLALLKAGMSYVPLDPSTPKERLAFICSETQTPFVLTQRRLLPELPELPVPAIALDAWWEEIALESELAPLDGVVGSNLAYVIYTSGSTGQPKGALITHEGLLNLVLWYQRVAALTPQDRTALTAGLAFDAAAYEIWTGLACGTTLCLPDEESRVLPFKLQNWLIECAITCCFVATPIAEELLQLDWPDAAGVALRTLYTGGDRLHRYPPASLSFVLGNLYGPSENTVITSYAHLEAGTQTQLAPPIGKPIDNVQVYVLDDALQPVAPGTAGELYIGGIGLARGYLHRPDLTAERFLPHPFSSEPGARLYRSGDLVRTLPDGNLDFLGRSDQQVKLRGYRIELGEIEITLTAHPAVQEAAVVLREERSGEKRLVAYIVPARELLAASADEQDAASLLRSQLRLFLSQRLPEYMLPTHFVLLERLPLTANGKIDRQALPADDPSQMAVPDLLAEKRTPTEEKLTRLWSQLLGVERVSINDNFFELGGHSLLATQMIGRLRQMWQVEMSLRSLFEAPTIAELATVIEEQVQRQGQQPPAPALLSLHDDQPSPLSFAQQRLWFLDQLEPGNPFYNISMAISMQGGLQVNLLERCLSETIGRHEVLRTSFAVFDGRPGLVVAPPLAVTIPLIDLSALAGEREREELVKALEIQEGRLPFQLTKSPLLRARLLRLDRETHLLLLSMHHIVSDDWSIEVFFRELSLLYDAFNHGQPSPLPALSLQYADYAAWQRSWLQGRRFDDQVTYWRRQLQDLPLLQLPSDHPHPVAQSHRGATFQFALNAAVTEGLRGVCQREKVTLFMGLLAAFQALLSRYSGQQDIAVGSPIANRSRAEVKDLIGFFVNTLVFRSTLTNTVTFADLLAQVRQTALDAYTHQDIPFEKLVEELQPERNLIRQPLFQAAFALLNDPIKTLRAADLSLSLLDIDNGTAKFDLILFIRDEREQLVGSFEYNADIFEATTIEHLAGHFRVLLGEATTHPDRPLAMLPLLTAHERQQILNLWNETHTVYPEQCCVHELFQQQAEQMPDVVALVYGEEHLTYDVLNSRANQLAHTLQQMAVGPEVTVGIYMERSPDLIIAMLGILKAGGVYLPLDLSYPAERLAFLLDDAGSVALLTQQHLREKLPTSARGIIALDTDWSRLASLPRTNPQSAVSAQNLAYVIYTSGSTGEPKGVAVAHRAINRLLCNTDYVRLAPDERVAQASNAAFDAATFEIWGALLHGARLVGIAKETALDPQVLRHLLREQGITTLFVTTALFNQSVKEAPDVFQSLRCLLFGGEAVDPHWVSMALRQGRPERLLHVYGPTENTTFSTWYEVRCLAEDAVTVPIGRPIANTQYYVLDRHLQPVPVGARGELYLGGAGLARGYLGQPALTAERYIPHPYPSRPGARLYKTGDLVRQLADGAIEFLGRVDSQVKIRGFRIELGEIEANLQQHPAVEEAVVVVREDIPGDKRLLAYVVPALKSEETERGELLPDAHVASWQELFEETYRSSSEESGGDFNIVGWNSSYTGQALPYEQMREWVEHTLEGIRACNPRRVLEIGCGTGLLLLRLAADCSKYWGTDFSEEALQMVQRQVQKQGLSQVQLLQRLADDFTGLEEQTFDTIILNSVIQYFPGVEYLVQVLEGALQKVVPGGTIFVGDIRNQQLLEAFHTSIELYKTPGNLSLEQLRRRIQAQMEQESELLIDPAFFYALQRRYPQIGQVCIRPKRGWADNELTTFRYEVQLKIGTITAAPGSTVAWRDWRDEGLSLAALERILEQQQERILTFTHIPNARLVRENAIISILSQPEKAALTLDDVQQSLTEQAAACTPEALYALGQRQGYHVDVRWSGCHTDGGFDAVFWLPSAQQEVQSLPWPQPEQVYAWADYANQPLREKVKANSRLVPQLRSYLQTRLSEYMIPSAFILLDALPLNANGKVDRQALPVQTQARPSQSVAYLPARNPVEEIVADIWVEVLGITQIGVRDNFFEIGGHSLLATQVIARINATFQIKMPLRTIFESSTVEGLVQELSQREPRPGYLMTLARLKRQLNTMSDDEIQEALQRKRLQRSI